MFAILAAAIGCVALADVYMNGRLTVIDPRLLGGLAVLGTGLLLFGIVSMRDKAQDLAGRTDRLTALTGELEAFIAALEAANARLNASEARYKGLVDSQGDAILRRTPDGRLTYANEAFYQLFGVRLDQVIGQVFRPELHPESPPPVFGKLAGREMGRERVRYDQHVKTVAGYRWIAWEDYAIRDAEGRLVEIQSVGRDITERKELEAELTVARDKAEEANRAKSHFLATMSHEIRTPMNGVLGMARLLLETHLSGDQKTYADAIQQSGIALLALIEDILDFSKIESGTMKLETDDVELRALIEGVCELLAPRAHTKGIELASAIAADVPQTIKTDAVRLRQVVTNLVGNAIKFTEEGGVLISVTCERRAPGQITLCLSVRDTGIGVPPEKAAQIFEEFVQVDSTAARRFEGTGLGLAISKRLVDALGGKIGIVPAADKGSVFWVTLPLGAKSIVEGAPPSPALAGKRIAIVSPSTLLRTGLKLQLQAAGAEIAEARNLEGLARIKQIDCILIDGGTSKEDKVPNIGALSAPAVALISPQARGQLAEFRALGVQHHVMKPLRQASVEKNIKAAIEGLAEEEAPQHAPRAEKKAEKSLSILLAEDNPVNALLARELLRRRGHQVTEVTAGDAAVAACAKNHFDLVLMDLHMPGLDGIEATCRIRTAEAAIQTRRTPIFALTADALETGRRACLEAGMDGFLTKPVDPEELDKVLSTLTLPARTAAA